MSEFFIRWMQMLGGCLGFVAIFALFMLPVFLVWQIHPLWTLVVLFIEVTGLLAADDVGFL